MNIKLVAIDLAKNCFQICGVNKAGKPIVNKKVNRNKLVSTVMQLAPEKVVMESCYSANYWGRKFQTLGFEVGAVPAQFVKAFVRGNKNDHNDAQAIAEAATRPNIRWVPIKTVAQQDLQSWHRVRERHIGNRTALLNQIRGLLSDNGVTVPQGRTTLTRALPLIIDDANNDLTPASRYLMEQLRKELSILNEQIKEDEKRIVLMSQENEDFERLMTIPGVGKILASTIIAAIGDGTQFKNGREFASWLGLTPRQYASGDKSVMGKISKRGNRPLRSLFVHGARAAMTRCKDRRSVIFDWADKLAKRSGKHKAWVAFANKLARIAWAILVNKSNFEMRAAV